MGADSQLALAKATGKEVNEMTTATLDAPVLDRIDDLDIALDMDFDVKPNSSDVGPQITSISLCTAGCTSPGGGSQCSWCC